MVASSSKHTVDHVERDEENVVTNWAQRDAGANDELLRSEFLALLNESATAPPDQRLIMYDACDSGEVRASLGDTLFRKRLDARRNTKPKKPDEQKFVCTPFDPNGFNFGKIRNDRERILKLALSAGRYDLLTNKFPLFPKHMLLVAKALVPQQMTGDHLRAICELQRASGFCAYFNSWCASASVNHFHCHLIDELPPVTAFPLVPGPLVAGVSSLTPQGFPGFCYVFSKSRAFPCVESIVRAMQEDNQPHNLLITPQFIYVFPKPHVRPARSFELYPETVGGPELIGSFTVYSEEIFDKLQPEHVEELVRINTAPLPTRVLTPAGPVDDHCVHSSVTTDRALSRNHVGSRTIDVLPSMPLVRSDSWLHEQSWPQDRPIARALMHGNGLV